MCRRWDTPQTPQNTLVGRGGCNRNNDVIDLQFLRYRARQTDICVILGHFMLFYPLPNDPHKIIFILHLCTKNLDDMIYSS